LQGLVIKLNSIEQYLEKSNYSWKDVWYIGNDVNDLGAIRKAKFSICPSDAVKAVKKEVDLKLKTKGGYGILEEIVTSLEDNPN
jgi:3-deoxy-D-manno-octulosonate 8-phosphate phosphatase (KDO 8-P phosphatase)